MSRSILRYTIALIFLILFSVFNLQGNPYRLWQVVDSVPHPDSGGDGLFIDGNYIWCVKSVEQITQHWVEIYKINKSNGQIVKHLTYDDVKSMDLVRMGSNLWVTDTWSDPNRIIVIDTANGNLVKQIQPSGGQPVSGLDWDAEKALFYSSGTPSGANVEFYTMDTLGNVEIVYTGSGISQPLGMALDRSTPNYLWICDWVFFPPQRVVRKISLNSSAHTYTIVETYNHPGASYALPTGIAYDIQDAGYIFTAAGDGCPWIWKVKVANAGIEEGLTDKGMFPHQFLFHQLIH